MLLGIGIPYYKNSSECEIAFKKMFITVWKQVTEETRFVVYEDGQVSDWLIPYHKGRTEILSCNVNHGVAYARNIILTRLINEGCDYILFLDSDDMIDCDYISKMYEACKTGDYDLIESPFIVNKQEYHYNLRDNVAGCAIRTELIKDFVFDEDYIISEDTLFIHKLFDKYKDLKRFRINSNYYYNYGINPNSLMKRFERSEIKLKKDLWKRS